MVKTLLVCLKLSRQTEVGREVNRQRAEVVEADKEKATKKANEAEAALGEKSIEATIAKSQGNILKNAAEQLEQAAGSRAPIVPMANILGEGAAGDRIRRTNVDSAAISAQAELQGRIQALANLARGMEFYKRPGTLQNVLGAGSLPGVPTIDGAPHGIPGPQPRNIVAGGTNGHLTYRRRVTNTHGVFHDLTSTDTADLGSRASCHPALGYQVTVIRRRYRFCTRECL